MDFVYVFSKERPRERGRAAASFCPLLARLAAWLFFLLAGAHIPGPWSGGRESALSAELLSRPVVFIAWGGPYTSLTCAVAERCLLALSSEGQNERPLGPGDSLFSAFTRAMAFLELDRGGFFRL